MEETSKLKQKFTKLFEDFSHLGDTTIIDALTESDENERIARKLLSFHQKQSEEVKGTIQK
jgi:hypothetical protein